MSNKENLPLKGIRVLEATMFAQGPVAGQLLSDLGAEVIKLEDPVMGDLSRGVGTPLYGRNIELSTGRNVIFECANRNKKSVTLDLRKPQARQVLYRLVEKSDVFLTNLTPKAMRKFGSEEETLRRYNPNIIYAVANAFGSKGPYGGYPGQDTTGIARSGLMLSMVKGDEPFYPHLAMSDILSGTMCAFGIVVALLGRERLGLAQGVEASQLGAMIWVQLMGIDLYANKGVEFLKYDREHGTFPLFNAYRCKDGKWIALGINRSERDWPTFCEIMGLPECIEDPRFNSLQGRTGNGDVLIKILDKAFAAKPRDEWETAFREGGIFFSVVNTVPDLLTDPQVLANDYIGEYESGLKLVNLPFQLSVSEVPLRGSAPDLGADTMDVLVNAAGFEWEEAGRLVSEGVI